MGVTTECESAMKKCGWRDSTGDRIISAIADSVRGELVHALDLCDSLDNIDTLYIEEMLSTVEEHLKERV